MRENNPPPAQSKVLIAALDYIGRGWCPIPIRYRTKKPVMEEWQHLRITEQDAARYFNGADVNLGIHLGPPSGGLADVDLDLPVAIGLADRFLPPSSAVFGRASKPRSHRLFILAGTGEKSVLVFDDPATGQRIAELRSGPGAQTVFPPSIHESGEAIEWNGTYEPRPTDGEDLARRVRHLAAAALLATHWGTDHSGRHNRAQAVGGVLGRAGWSAEQAGEFVGIVARAAWDDDAQDRAAAARDSVENLEKRNVWGLPELRRQLGPVVAVADRFAEWVGYTEAAGRFPKFDHVKIVGDGEDTEWTITSGPHTVTMSSDDVYSQLIFGRRWFAITGQGFHQMKKNAWADFITKEHARAERRPAEVGSSRQDQFQAELTAYLDTRRRAQDREDMWRRGLPWDDDAGDPPGFWFPMTHSIGGFRRHLDTDRSPFREESGIKLGRRLRDAGGRARDLSIDGRTRAMWFVPRDKIEAVRGAAIPPIKRGPM